MRLLFLILIVSGLLSGCDGSDGGASPELPAFFRLEGSASLQAGQQTLDCHIGFIVELVGDGFSEIRARLTFPDRVLIEAVNLPPYVAHDPPSFFEELTRFEGTLGPAELMSGGGLCAPFFTDRDGFEDDTLFADGLWFTETITK
jgi:hypothetical protein